ncbi:alpha/beta hydrolase [Actinobacteria bacterium YIM 96077]|uniref:Alpha/beta hydrolase n=1 Tax=Phytoactinopolyspora halophila TaxID=1981511 RepID=A0A329QLH5_9ACTN|nr:alpha/beta hydrolase [Phytoactinopolyspora halophila]AYY12527.1 alpha/beta hydrolase [Actinobacteria bacterium YIM 96077]RAW12569.1 alpha/beta hydrolase [Phytoactinopolyspora halophila]
MTLDPAVKTLLDGMAGSESAPPGPISAPQMRAAFAAGIRLPDPLEPVGSVRDLHVPGPGGAIPVRLYTPDTPGPWPAYIWLHGGGWTIGSANENEVASRAVCNAAGVAVVAAEYRLAPEHPFPAAPHDCYAVLEWVAAHGGELGVDGTRVAIGGESAGGNLATVVAMMSRDRGGPPIRAQVPVCPVYGHPDDGFASYVECATGYGMTAGAMRFFFDQYVTDPAQLADPYLLPLRATHLRGLPPALIMTAQYDVLRDEGEEFARRLADAGVDVELARYDGQIHGFYGLHTELPAAARSHAHAAGFLRRTLAG